MQDGTAPTTMLAHWARDRTQGTGQIPIEICVQKQARDTVRHSVTLQPRLDLEEAKAAEGLWVCAQAYVYGFTDRGTLEVGKKAGTHPTLSRFQVSRS